MNYTLKNCLLAIATALLFYACPNEQKIPQTNSEIAKAIRENNTKAITLWLENGGDVNQQLDHQQSFLYDATGPKGGHEMVKLLLDNGAKVDVGAGKYTPLMNAASWVDLENVQLLLEKGADKTLTNENGRTAYELIGGCGDCPALGKLKALLKTAPMARYICENGTRLTAMITGEQATVKLMAKDQDIVAFTAQRVQSASGAKYQGEGYTYWPKGKECLIEKDNVIIHQSCHEIQNYEGTFSYMADANMFVSCDGALRMPVEMEGDYLELERAYGQLVEGGTSVYVRMQGYPKEVPAMEGDGMHTAFILTHLLDIDKDKTCSDLHADASDDQTANNIINYLKTDYLKGDLATMEQADRQFQLFKIDLNGDGRKEYFVRFLSPYFCGTGGCTFLLLDADFQLINKFTVTNPPIFVSKVKENGWATMMVKSEGAFRQLIYKDGKYPSNPTVLPKSDLFPSGHDAVLFEEGFTAGKIYTF